MRNKNNACYGFNHQMYNWSLPYVNSSLNVRGVAIWQHKIFKVVTDRSLWSKKYRRSAVFLKKHLRGNESKRSSVRIPSIFSNGLAWATTRRTMERSWHLHSMYPIMAAGRNLPQSWHLSKLTMVNRKSNFKTCVAHTLGGPINYRTLNSSSRYAELKHTLIISVLFSQLQG